VERLQHSCASPGSPVLNCVLDGEAYAATLLFGTWLKDVAVEVDHAALPSRRGDVPRDCRLQRANIANGPQQMNNAPQAGTPRAENPEIPQSKLLEVHNGERLDTITRGGALGSDPAMATVETFDRAAHG
jgi:hypothetical protein